MVIETNSIQFYLRGCIDDNVIAYVIKKVLGLEIESSRVESVKDATIGFVISSYSSTGFLTCNLVTWPASESGEVDLLSFTSEISFLLCTDVLTEDNSSGDSDVWILGKPNGEIRYVKIFDTMDSIDFQE